MDNNVFSPVSVKQRLVLQDTTTDVILVGGGAGGGKSATCIMKNLDGIHDQHFKCTVFRRTQPELKRQGGLIDESKQFYSPFEGVYKRQAMTWEFPSGAKVSFAAIATDDDLGSWQGSQLVRALVDEAADKWTQTQILFLLSRLRSAHSKIHPQLILTCNPDRQSFLYEWVEWCLDKETGVPKPGTENIIKWFCAIDNKVMWGESPEEVFELYGKPRGKINGYGLSDDELKKIPPDKLFLPKSFRFVPTNVYDNGYLLPPRNMSYLPNLLAQPRINQLKYLHGSWTAQAEGSGYFKRSWVEIVERPPLEVTGRVRAYDLAATVPSETNRDPDYTAGVKISRTRDGTYWVEDVYRFRKRTGDVIESIISTAKDDGIEDCQVIVPKDSGAAGTAFNSHLIRTLAENGIAAKTTVISGHRGKIQRFLPFASLCESGNVKIVRGDWNEEFFEELESFDGGRKGHDDKQTCRL